MEMEMDDMRAMGMGTTMAYIWHGVHSAQIGGETTYCPMPPIRSDRHSIAPFLFIVPTSVLYYYY